MIPVRKISRVTSRGRLVPFLVIVAFFVVGLRLHAASVLSQSATFTRRAPTKPSSFVEKTTQLVTDSEPSEHAAVPTTSVKRRDEWDEEADMVRQDMRDAFGAYKQYAWGHDQLRPISKGFMDWGGPSARGLALSAVDALDTLWIMGLESEFSDAVDIVSKVRWEEADIKTSVFESTIRIVGGTVSAYEISGEKFPQLLNTAQRVANMLLSAFNTSSGLPHQTLYFRTRQHWNAGWTGGASILADMASNALEFRTLSFHTKDPTYDIKATHVFSLLTQRCKQSAYLCPVMFDPDTGMGTRDQQTLGAYGDSFYEYFGKQYLLTGASEDKYKDMTITMLDAVLDRFIRRPTNGRLYLTDSTGTGIMEHLACFVGGMFALAAVHVAPRHHRRDEYMTTARGLTDTCYHMYTQQRGGIAPDSVSFTESGEFHTHDAKYILRPETVESIFYLWRLTGEEKYRKMARVIYRSIREKCKVNETGGFTGFHSVDSLTPDDQQQTFFLAETMKYIYLTFAPPSKVPLSEWVFNTEGHPFRIRSRDPMRVWRDWEDNHDGSPAFLPPTVNGIDPIETARMKAVRKSMGGRVVAPRDPNSFRTDP